MATNSKREQIVAYIVEEIQELDLFHVTRILPAYSELSNFAVTQFPVAAVAAGMPLPVGHKEQRQPGGKDAFLSQLDITVFVWENILLDSDTKLSHYADELWVKLWEDKTKGGLVHATDVFFEENPTYMRPYISFNTIARVTYYHTTGGI